jgi:tetratricopeptide (TPR) repeat protein
VVVLCAATASGHYRARREKACSNKKQASACWTQATAGEAQPQMLPVHGRARVASSDARSTPRSRVACGASVALPSTVDRTLAAETSVTLTNSKTRNLLRVLLLAYLQLWVLGFVHAETDRMLDYVEYFDQDGKVGIRVVFVNRMSYIKHFPAERASTLEVQLKVVVPELSERQQFSDREVLLAPLMASVPLVGVTMERSNDVLRPTLTFRFREPVDYHVAMSNDGFSLEVGLPNITFVHVGKKPRAEQGPGLTPPDIAPAPTGDGADVDGQTAISPAVAPAPSTGTNTDKARELLDAGRQALDAKEYDQALGLFANALNLPDHPYGDEAQNLFIEARRLRRQAAAPPPPSPPVAPASAAVAAAETDWQQQLSDGRAALAVGEFARAIALLSAVAREAPSDIAQEAAAALAQAGADQTPADAAAEQPPRAEQPQPEPETVAPAPPPAVTPARADVTAEAKHLLDAGTSALSAGSTEEAIQYFTQLLALPANDYTPDAERLLRTARGAAADRARADPEEAILQTPETVEDLEKLMEQGRLALRRGDNNRAIVIFTKAIGLPEHQFMADALELLGLARQRNDQPDRAKLIYEDYLRRYPTGAGAERVRQRLAELVSVGMKPQAVPQEIGQSAQSQFRSDTFGSLSQTFNFGVREVPVEEDNDSGIPGQPGRIVKTTQQDQSLLSTYITTGNRTRNDRYDIRGNFNGIHQKNYLEDDGKDKLLINQMYVDFTDRQRGYGLKLGRQSGSMAGTLGRFDGLLGGYDLSKKLRVNAAVGFPVDLSNKDSIDFDTFFMATNVQFKDVLPQLDILPFVSYQSVAGGNPDRLAIGEELRYFNPRGTVFQMLDYDTLYSGLNLFFVQGQLNLSQSSALYASFDYRATPFYTLRNSLRSAELQNSGLTTLEDLLANRDISEVRTIAAEYTSDAIAILFGGNYAASEKVQLSSDVSWGRQYYSDGEIADAQGNLPDSTDGYSLTGRVTTNGIIGRAEITILSLTYSSFSDSSETSFWIQNRAPFLEGWRVDSELRTSWRDDSFGQSSTRIQPVLKLVYEWKRIWEIEVEGGMEITKFKGTETAQDGNRYFGSVGYRLSF